MPYSDSKGSIDLGRAGTLPPRGCAAIRGIGCGRFLGAPLMKLIFSAVAASAAMLIAGQALAAPACEPTAVRVSKLKPGATFAQFQDAMKDHMAWYRSHGYTANNQTGAPLLVFANGKMEPSKDEVLTLHTNAPGVPRDKQDAGWTAYIAKYRAVSDIEHEFYACLPK